MMMVLVLTVGLGAALAGTEPRGEPPGELPTTIAPDAVFALGGVRPASFTQAEPVRLASDGPIPRWFDGTVGLAYPDTSGGDLVWRFVQAEEVAPAVLFPAIAVADSLADVIAAIEAAADSLSATNAELVEANDALSLELDAVQSELSDVGAALVAVTAERDALAAERAGLLTALRALLARLLGLL